MEKETKYKENNTLSTPLSTIGFERLQSLLTEEAVDFIDENVPRILFTMLRHYINDPKIDAQAKWNAVLDVEYTIALHTELRIIDETERFRWWEQLPNGEFKAPINE